MSLALADRRPPTAAASETLQLATFYVDSLLIGVEIDQVQEINRQLDVTDAPHAPAYVRGVINLRGEVATVIDLRAVLELPPASRTRDSRNLIVAHASERVGLWVDRIADIVEIEPNEITPPPANVRGVDGRFFRGIHNLEHDVLLLLDLEAALHPEG